MYRLHLYLVFIFCFQTSTKRRARYGAGKHRYLGWVWWYNIDLSTQHPSIYFAMLSILLLLSCIFRLTNEPLMLSPLSIIVYSYVCVLDNPRSCSFWLNKWSTQQPSWIVITTPTSPPLLPPSLGWETDTWIRYLFYVEGYLFPSSILIADLAAIHN